MGKKLKIGKQRRDKYYYLAKEAGYRSRAAFKLIQLNKRFGFLSRCRALVDLCAAPGGWLQVASQNMPVSSVRIGIDLVPIKPISNCITLQGDITTESARQMIKKELQTWEADCVLHDGAPNVGLNWQHDAFQQNCLTLSALKLATQVLSKNGYFVTKIFRSSDYHSLIEVFGKLFKRVHVWKPAASRLESAEIFVVCEKYFKPSKISSALLDPKKVFAGSVEMKKMSNPQLMLNLPKKEKKTKAEGYDQDKLVLYKSLPATEFVQSKDYLDLLSEASEIVLDNKKFSDAQATNQEVLACLADVKVCGPRELRTILQWRKKMQLILAEDDHTETRHKQENKTTESDPDASEDEELARIDSEIAAARTKDKAALKKKKKKLLKEKAKLERQRKLGMIHKDDFISSNEEQELFSLKKIRRAKDLIEFTENANEQSDVHGSSDNEETAGDELNDGEWETTENVEYDSDGGAKSGGIVSEDVNDDDDDDDPNTLIYNEESVMTKEERAEYRASKWFEQSSIAELLNEHEDNDELRLSIIENQMKQQSSKVSDKNGVIEYETGGNKSFECKEFVDEKWDEESEESYHDEDRRTAMRDEESNKPKDVKKERKRRLTPEQLALGEKLIRSSKTRRDVEDWGWNRFTNNDEGLPDWFVEDEKKHYCKELPVTKDAVLRYRERLKEINVRPIKKILEAKGRKRRRELLKLEKAKKKAENIIGNENMENSEKQREIRKLYQAAKQTKKEVKYQVVTKGTRGRISRPDGRFKLVDKRLKKDTRNLKMASKRKGKGRTHGGFHNFARSTRTHRR
ncbi:hypothetical protein AB6A40_000240 [Gnathostoma spinigerum]|uniref:Putative rRNA methyltransferase n=1 Tax=Gnathostoma spinigerum TaxID=75299 RepID=A0ABD6E3P6_9BILA